MIPYNIERYENMSIDDLIIGLQLAWDYINGPDNDGRQTSSSSAELDYWMEEATEMWQEIKRRNTKNER